MGNLLAKNCWMTSDLYKTMFYIILLKFGDCTEFSSEKFH